MHIPGVVCSGKAVNCGGDYEGAAFARGRTLGRCVLRPMLRRAPLAAVAARLSALRARTGAVMASKFFVGHHPSNEEPGGKGQ